MGRGTACKLERGIPPAHGVPLPLPLRQHKGKTLLDVQRLSDSRRGISPSMWVAGERHKGELLVDLTNFGCSAGCLCLCLRDKQ